MLRKRNIDLREIDSIKASQIFNIISSNKDNYP